MMAFMRFLIIEFWCGDTAVRLPLLGFVGETYGRARGMSFRR